MANRLEMSIEADCINAFNAVLMKSPYMQTFRIQEQLNLHSGEQMYMGIQIAKRIENTSHKYQFIREWCIGGVKGLSSGMVGYYIEYAPECMDEFVAMSEKILGKTKDENIQD